VIDAATRASVLATTTAYWQDMATKSHFRGLAAGKEIGKNGQPNLVSLTKLLDRLLEHQIDSYDLLIVKIAISSVAAEAAGFHLVPHIYFVDVLDHLDFVTFDMGPGQTMLREQQFCDAVDSGYQAPNRSLTDKVEVRMALMEDGYRRVLGSRQSRMDSLRRNLAKFRGETGLSIDQTGLNFGG
jgi:hypothetical protein